MSPEWSWFAGEPKGKCPGCTEYLRRPDMLIEWRTRVYHIGCLVNLLVAVAPSDPYVYHPPGADWKSP